jgi:hypothetical protein
MKTIDEQLDNFSERMWALRVRHEGWTPKEEEQQRFLKMLMAPPPSRSRLLDAVNEIRSRK